MAVDGRARAISRENPQPGVLVTPLLYPKSYSNSTAYTFLLNWPNDTKAIYLGAISTATNNGVPWSVAPAIGGVTMATIANFSAAQNTRHIFGHWMTLGTMQHKRLSVTFNTYSPVMWVAALRAQSRIVYVTYSAAATSGTLDTPDTSAYDPVTALITAYYKLGSIYATPGVGIVDYGDSGLKLMGASITNLYGQKTCTFSGTTNTSVSIAVYRDTSVLGA